jgi:hypothetical protein
MVGVPARQEQALAAISERLAGFPGVLGALVVGSLASGAADAASDVDLIVCARPGGFASAWQHRHDLHASGALVCWDDGLQASPQAGVHRWVTPDMVLVEVLFAAPGGGVRLASPWRLIAGNPHTASSFPPRRRSTAPSLTATPRTRWTGPSTT